MVLVVVVGVGPDSAACAGATIDSTTGLVQRAGNSITVTTPPTMTVIFLQLPGDYNHYSLQTPANGINPTNIYNQNFRFHTRT